MAWRFKASKYKNAAPIVPKPEMCVRDIIVGSYQNYGNSIAASAAFMAFNWEHTGTSLAVLPIDDCGRKSKTMPLLHAHSDTVTDLEFSPFHDGLLATGSQDCLVKIWHIPEQGLSSSITNPECTFSHKQRRIERVGFHPTADCLLHSTSAGTVILWDITVQEEAFSNNDHPEVIQSLSWKRDGTVFSTTCKDKMIRVMDPRASNSIVLTADSHQSIKDSRVVWLGEQNRILTSGFDSARLRQVIIRDIRNFGTPEKTLELDCSTGILMPLFDPDTNMLFLAGKGDSTITYWEVTEKDPHLIEGLRHTGEQTKGACLVPKRALRVMEGEVNRVLQLTSNSVIPIMYQVPRKTYRDFHSDLYPETYGYKTELTATHWLKGTNIPVPKISLDPAKRELGAQPIMVHRGNLTELIENINNKNKKVDDKKPLKESNIIQQAYIPIKDKIKQMEELNKFSPINISEKGPIDNKQDNNKQTKNEDNLKKTIAQKINETDQQIIENNMKNNGTNKDNDDSPDALYNGTGVTVIDTNSTGNDINKLDSNRHCPPPLTPPANVIPPTPLPRTSRTNSVTSISEQTSDESNNGSLNNGNGNVISVTTASSTAPRPSPRPRVTSGGYKPRLGPKPFIGTGATEDFSFDKVFSVPQVPGTDSNNGSLEEEEEEEQPKEEGQPKEEEQTKEEEQLKEEEQPKEEENYTNENLIIDEIPDIPEILQDVTETKEEKSTSNEEEKITTVVEEVSPTKEEVSIKTIAKEEDDSVDDKLLPRNEAASIAERRKMYEHRSLSIQEEKTPSPTPLRRRNSLKNWNGKDEDGKEKTSSTIGDGNAAKNTTDTTDQSSASKTGKRTSTVFGRVSKYRHLKGTPGHKSTHIENVRNISRQLPGECDGFHANYERAAVPIAGAGGKIAIYELDKTGRLPDGVIPTLVNGSNIMDFQWDPFDPKRLAVACDDGIVKFWLIPDGGLTEPINTPNSELLAHSDKIYFIKFHPSAKNVLLTSSYDMTMKLWDLEDMTEKICLTGHTDQIFSFAWSPCGVFGATVSKDGKLRVYNPRKSPEPIAEGPGPVGTRGARVVWTIDGQYIVVTGFDKVSERQITIYKKSNLSMPLNTVGIDVSPSILIPFYDEDSSTLFLTGKGDSTIYNFEITDEQPFICPLSHHRGPSVHQGLSFLPKNKCNVLIVEFAKALRLTNNSIEWLSFTVPRIKSELFQDDLFPPTRVTWVPSMTSKDWFSSKDKMPNKISLQPEGMPSLSSSRPAVSLATKGSEDNSSGDSGNPLSNFIPSSIRNDIIKQKEKDIKSSLSDRMEANLSKVVHDTENGVDEEEWDEKS